MDEVTMLKAIFSFEPDTGLLRWKDFPSEIYPAQRSKHVAGSIAGAIGPKGYIRVRMGKINYQAHRLAWLLHTGAWPSIIDHIDGNKTNNRIANLREVTYSESNKNLPVSRASKTGVVGVSYCPKRRKYKAKIGLDGREKFLGHFDKLEDAAAARKAAEVAMNYHPNHGRAA